MFKFFKKKKKKKETEKGNFLGEREINSLSPQVKKIAIDLSNFTAVKGSAVGYSGTYHLFVNTL